MKKYYYLLLILFFSCDNDDNVIIVSCEGEYSTANILTDIDEKIFNDDESINANSIYSWSSDNNYRILTGNGIPNHEVGTFPNGNNPNRIREQSINERFTLCRTIFSETGL